MIFYGIVCASLQHFRHVCPFVAQERMRQKENPFFRKAPISLHDGRVEMVMPAFPALLSQPAGHETSDEGPTLRPVLVNETYERAILIIGPGILSEYPVAAGAAGGRGVRRLGARRLATMRFGQLLSELLNHRENN